MFIRLIDNPLIILALPFLIFVFLKILEKPQIGLYIVAALIPLEDATTLFTNFTLVKMFIGITVLSWFLYLRVRNMPIIFSSNIHIIFLAVWSSLSMIWAYDRSVTIYFLNTFIPLTTFLITIPNIINSRNIFKNVMLIFIASCVICSIWISYNSYINPYERGSIFIGQNPNGVSRVLGLSFIALIISYRMFKFKPAIEIIRLASLIFLVTSILLAQSRGTFVAILLSLLFIVDLRSRQIFKLISFIFVAIIILQYFYYESLQFSLIPRVLSFISEGDLGGRRKIWEVATDIIGDNWLSGVGFGNFANIFGEYSLVSRGWYSNSGSHNVYISIFSDLGIVGITIFAIYHIDILIKTRKIINVYNEGLYILGLFVYNIASGLTTNMIISKFYWFTFGILLSAISLMNMKGFKEEKVYSIEEKF